MRRRKLFRIVSLTLVFVLMAPFFSTLISSSNSQAYAAEIDRRTAYKGLALTALVVYIIHKFKDDDSSRRGQSKKNKIDYSNDQLTWLARAIHGEARGESYLGKIAVAAVIINRVKSDQFPDTIYSVIHQQGQFSSVDDGQINLVPNEAAYKAAKEALNGRDPSSGALYFYNPKTAKTLWWLESRDKTVQIGDHVFAK